MLHRNGVLRQGVNERVENWTFGDHVRSFVNCQTGPNVHSWEGDRVLFQWVGAITVKFRCYGQSNGLNPYFFRPYVSGVGDYHVSNFRSDPRRRRLHWAVKCITVAGLEPTSILVVFEVF